MDVHEHDPLATHFILPYPTASIIGRYSHFAEMRSKILRCGLCASMIAFCCLETISISIAQTNPSLVNPDEIPAQIVPTYKEVGITWGGIGGGNSPPTTSGTDPGGNTSGNFTTLNILRATDYGTTADRVAQQQGVNLESIAAVGEAESGFRNVATNNGSSSATGPWQFTTGTFQTVSDKYGLGYTASDITDPEAQATEVSYLMRDNANTGHKSRSNLRRPCKHMAFGYSGPHLELKSPPLQLRRRSAKSYRHKLYRTMVCPHGQLVSVAKS